MEGSKNTKVIEMQDSLMMDSQMGVDQQQLGSSGGGYAFSETSYLNGQEETTCYQDCLTSFGDVVGNLRSWVPCLCCLCPYPYKKVRQSQAGLLQTFGKFTKIFGPGLHKINPCTQQMIILSKQIQIMQLDKQLILTKDNLTVHIDAVIYYKLIDFQQAYYMLQNIKQSIQTVTIAALRTIAGEFTLQNMLEKRQELSYELQKFLLEHTTSWGINICSVQIKDMQISESLQYALSSAAKAQRLGQSKVISAKADVESAKLLRQAADILDSKAAMQIRYLEVLNGVSQNGVNNLMFLPLDDKDMKYQDEDDVPQGFQMPQMVKQNMKQNDLLQ